MRRRLRLSLAAAIVPAIALTTAGAAGAAPTPEPSGRIIAVQRAAAEPGVSAVKDTYIVELKQGVRLRSSLGIAPQRQFSSAVNGFSAKLTPAQLAALQKHPDVVAISEDVYVANALDATQTNPPSWGIDRIDQRNLPLSRSYTYTRTGTGVHAYIIDSGVDPSHPNFGGRATFDFNGLDSNNTDCNGHGTHVAGTIGSSSYGVAKNVRLHGVKWLNCSGGGTASAAIAAVDWVTRNAIKPAVANTSWNFTANTTLENSLRRMISSGVFLATSAGNTGANSCHLLPRKIETALVTAASTSTDARASYSSTGSCVDVYAPGSAIVSTLPGNTTGSYNGTSMATPHVAGVAALYLQTSPSATPATVKSYLESSATPNVVSGGGTGGTVNRLLFTNGL
ncbi:peptidase S8 and S53 subtilisin kexin sedolisin [Kribbella flavida DSM 17836]|uniref:Peptidase S8 and S53 subtilisin kexin sedolisin n=1 Tax=Kribbella flavida (strain DSM 17836 / JCM 10339 / NBRC 14399) TaxID=479435 RepID=D2PZB6_KRIFD|nr:S8 family peptidase [Kribbella flavida]ADB33725.1 peptidase S8 and S53 subtilisin kexin sedolisin [Kribbella flavida DSM 17836]